jgi:hypothetical protein
MSKEKSKKEVITKVNFKKLKLGDKVYIRFLGAKELAEVIEITDSKNHLYKVELIRGTKLPKVTWLDEKSKEKPFWYIDSLFEGKKSEEI